MGADTDSMRHACDERAALAHLLQTLTPEQWDAPTLCAQWRVRDVVALVVSYEDLGLLGLSAALTRGGFRVDRVNDLLVRVHATAAPADLLARVRAHPHPQGLTARFGGRVALVDGMIHQQDIRRPLGLPREIPAARLATALSFARFAPPVRAAQRIRGLRLEATDLDWAAGNGPVVRGPAESLLMAMAGRAGTQHELDGPGQPTLAARIRSRSPG